MPKRFTPDQIAASAAIGELRTQQSFEGDTEAWHTYQDSVYSKLRPGEALHASRPVLWKAATRQLKKIEEERNKPVKKVKKIKKLKVSTRKEYAGVSDVQLGSPRPSACGTHVVCQLTANVHGYGSAVEDVYYEQPPAEGESDKETKMRADRHRRREQVALEKLSYGHMRSTYSAPRGHHGYGLYSSKGRRKTK